MIAKTNARLFIIVLMAVSALAVAFFLLRSTIFTADAEITPSLKPKPGHVAAVRFDPSFHYDRKMRPENLAASLAQKWAEAGINLVFFRAYDPRHGAFYRTEYRFNAMGDFGRYDLLGHVLEACHARGIRVFAWLPVLNHAGAWEANASWRTLIADGAPYTVEGLNFPLCARQPEARTWWSGFIEDLLDGYPALDGIDLAEPVVSWRPDDACHCDLCRKALTKADTPEARSEIRAEALSEVLQESIALIRHHGKQVCITSIQGADASGDLLPLQEMRRITGLDLEKIVQADIDHLPDFLCPEFLWQEHRSHFLSPSKFDPRWTQGAVRSFLQQVDRPIPVVAHVEITDFPGVTVSGEDLERALEAAMAGGAAGVDVYNADQLDRKSAWDAFEAAAQPPRKQCLVLFDQSEGEEDGENDARQVAALLGHFNASAVVKPISSYGPAELDSYDTVFYVGTASDTAIPDAFLQDLAAWPGTVCWLGFNIQAALEDPELSRRWGLAFAGVESDRFRRVHYRQTMLPKRDPWANIVEVMDTDRCQVLAEATDKERRIPYAIRSGRRYWYFADVPTSHAIEGGRLLVFADLLHEILNEPHVAQSLAMVRIEDVHPLTDPKTLESIADFLHSRSVPFHLAVVPFYINPEANLNVGLHHKPALAEAIRYCVRKGAAVVMHGATHQRFGETTADYEFWDPLNDRPPEGENRDTIRKKIERGLNEFWSVGIYPLMWETPHYAGSQRLYETVESIFSLRMERPQSMDRLGTDQYFPYLVAGKHPDCLVVPENLGYIPLEEQQAEILLDPARRMRVVRDGVASFFFHPFIDLTVLEEIVDTLQKEGVRFTSVADLPIRVETPLGFVTNVPAEKPSQPTEATAKEVRLTFPGILKEKIERQPASNEPMAPIIPLKPGELIAVYDASTKNTFEARAIPTSKPDAAVSTVSNFLGEACQVPVPLVLDEPAAPLVPSPAADALSAMFRMIGVPVKYLEIESFFDMPGGINLVVVPGHAAERLSDDQVQVLIAALRAGDIALITSGDSPLADTLGIETTAQSMTVADVRDNYFADLVIAWDPPVRLARFESPGDAAYIYEDAVSGAPLVVSGPLGKGAYLYLAAFSNPDEQIYMERFYPHLLSHMFRRFNFFPPIRRTGATVYFNPAEREEVSIEALVKDWQRSGVGTVYAAAWHVYPEWTYDYGRLIRLAHANGILVYAWFELPYVNERFWQAHPDCREKNALGQDAKVKWRKPTALGSARCREAVKVELQQLLSAGNWDGVVLNRAGWESENGWADPKTLTPFHPEVRQRFQAHHGFDPVALFDPGEKRFYPGRPEDADRFQAFRQTLAEEWLTDLLQWLSEWRAERNRNWTIVLTYDETRPHAGLSLEAVAALKSRFDIELQLATDPRKQWAGASPPFDRVQLLFEVPKDDLAFFAGAPTTYPTGLKMYHLLNQLIDSRKSFSINSENSLFEVDKHILPFLLATGSKILWTADGLHAELPASGKIVFAGADVPQMTLDDRLCASQYHHTVILPAGIHRLAPASDGTGFRAFLKSDARILDCTANLLDATVTSLGVMASYSSDRRAALVVTEKPLAVWVDGDKIQGRYEHG